MSNVQATALNLTIPFYSILFPCPYPSRTLWVCLQTAQMDKTLELAMKSPITVALVLPSLPVLWIGQTAAMVYATMNYKTTPQTADVNLQCINSLVKVWLWLWRPEILWAEATLLYPGALVSSMLHCCNLNYNKNKKKTSKCKESTDDRSAKSRETSIKLFSIQPYLTYLFHPKCITEKDVCREFVYWTFLCYHSYLASWFLLICHPYISLHI